MITESIRAFLLIFAAEMGDKSQLLAMTFATQYGTKEVLIGISIGVFLNHGLAIALGKYLSRFVPIGLIELIAGIMFIAFGLLALNEEELHENEDQWGLGPIITVAIAFFICELGDKTQIMAMTLSAEGSYPIFILTGTTLGMLATSGVAIFIGSRIGERIPDILVKIISSLIFVSFGTLKLYNWFPKEMLNSFYIMTCFMVIISIQVILIIKLIMARRNTRRSPMKEVAANLHRKVRVLNEFVGDICLGEESCGCCSGRNCIIGYTKELLENAIYRNEYYTQDDIKFSKLIDKEFDQNKVIEALSLIIADYARYGIVEKQNFIINQVRGSFETILFRKSIRFNGDVQRYLNRVKRVNYHIGKILESKIESKVKVYS